MSTTYDGYDRYSPRGNDGLPQIGPFWPRGAAHLGNAAGTILLIVVAAIIAGIVVYEVLYLALSLAGRRPSSDGLMEIASSAAVLLAGWLCVLQGPRLAPQNPSALVPFERPNWKWFLILGAILLVGDFLLFRAIERMMPNFPVYMNAPTDMGAIPWFLFASVIAFPIGEEIIFRGVLHTAVKRTMGVAAAIILPTILFAFVHYEPTMLYALAILPGSFIFAIAREKTGGVTTPILLHMVSNAAADAALFMQLAAPLRG